MLEKLKHMVFAGDLSFREKWQKVSRGLKAPKDSGEYKYAVFELQRVFGPGTVSVSIMVILLLAMILIKTTGDSAPPELEVTMMDPETTELEEIVEEKIIEPEETLESLEPSDEMSEVNDVVTEAQSFGDESTDDLVPAAADIIKSPLVLKGLYGNRSAGGRSAAAGKYGGGGAGGALTAVLKALRWLKANQNEDGSWTGADARTAMTGLALLCYMAHGETPASDEFGPTVEKAIRYLLYAQAPNGRFKSCGNNYVYGHAIATYGLAETYGMTKIVMVKDPVGKGLQVIIDGQQPGGAWDYEYAKGTRRDLSVSAWQIQALKAAKMAGIENEALEPAIEKAMLGLKSFSAGQGYLSYGEKPDPSPTLTGAGVLCMQLLGKAADPLARDGINALQNMEPRWEDAPHNNTYAWYYITQANFQNGGGQWEKWNKQMLPMLVKNQSSDGHWDRAGTLESCPVYDTTLCCLCLEVYYRYLPTFERVEEVKAPPKTQDERDVKIAVGDAL